MDYKEVEQSARIVARLSQPWILAALLITAALIIAIVWHVTPQHVEKDTSVQSLDLPNITLPSQTKGDDTNLLTKQEMETVTVKRGDSLAKILYRQGVTAGTTDAIMKLGRKVKPLLRLRPKEQLKLLINDDKQLQQLVYKLNQHQTLIITRIEKGYQAEVKSLALEPRQHYVMGEIKGSLLRSGLNAGLSRLYVYQLAKIFAWDIDFSRDLRAGDKFVVIYEDFYSQGKKVKEGPILAAEIITKKKNFRAIRFIKPNGDAEYYAPDGRSMRKAFLRAPVRYSRISSPFNLHRYHPVLHVYRPHKGVDLAAPRGTPVRASSDGKIVLIGRDGGYGNAIKIRHNAEYETVYGHLQRFARGLRRGNYVKQGQLIGYVGSTGLATGPHLHYEFHVYGRPVNPMKVKLPAARPIAKKYKHKFMEESRALVAQLDLYQSAQLASSGKASKKPRG